MKKTNISSHSNKFMKLQSWLKLENDNVRMYDKDSRGLYSTHDIKKDDIIMKIPSKYIIEFSNINKSKIVDKLYNKNSYVATYLLIKANQKKSFWKEYLDSMPDKLDEYIYYYKKDKLNQLKNTSIMCSGSYTFTDHMNNIVNDSKIIYEWLLQKDLLPCKLKNYNNFFKAFLYYRILVCSRIFGYYKNSGEEIGMVPYADLLNHSHSPNTTWYFDDNLEAFIVKATTDIKKNSEILDSYGDKKNIELIMYYGFSIKNNIYSELNFMHNNQVINVTHKDSIISLMNNNEIHKNDKDKIIKKLKKISDSHKIKIKKVNDNNIKNIYNDEIRIIDKVLKKI